MRIHLATLAASMLGLFGCDSDDSDDGAATTVSTSVSTSVSTTEAVEDSGDDDDADPSTTAGTTAPATTSDEESSGGAGEESTGGGGTDPGTDDGAVEASSTGPVVGVCDPIEGGDTCEECTKQKCCAQLEACFADPICECMSGCVMGLGDVAVHGDVRPDGELPAGHGLRGGDVPVRVHRRVSAAATSL